MFASKRWSGSRGNWWATHAMIHSFNAVSALSLREYRDGCSASGQVCATASSTQTMKVATRRRSSKCITDLESGGLMRIALAAWAAAAALVITAAAPAAQSNMARPEKYTAFAVDISNTAPRASTTSVD